MMSIISVASLRKPSRSFVSALLGVAMTLFAWYGPWAWPAAPGFFVLRTFFGGGYDELAYAARVGVIVLLIAVNVGAWAVVAFGVMTMLRRVPRGKTD
jgi:multisubunit Na+/H+ antiporter MnhB subunit